MRYTTRIIVPPRIRRSGQPGGGGAYKPQVLGVRRSFGFDDPFGVATSGHLGAVARHPDIAPVLVQQTFTDHDLGAYPVGEIMASAMRVISNGRYRQPWGADANLLRNPQEVENAAAAGFTYYTLDPTEFLRHDVDRLAAAEVSSALDTLIEEGTLNDDWCQPYLDRTIDLPGNQSLTLTLAPLQRAALKYGRAIRHCARLSEAVARANHGHLYETEAFFGATPAIATALEHLFIGLELEARGVRLTSLALPLVGRADARSVQSGDASEVEIRLQEHAAVAEFCGPYKLSFHTVSLLPSLFPVLGDCCRDALHIKTQHLSFLEAMRVIYQTEGALFEVVMRAALDSSDGSAARTHENFLSAILSDPERDWLDEFQSESFMTNCAAAVFRASDHEGRPLRMVIAKALELHADIYREQLTVLFDKRLQLLKAG